MLILNFSYSLELFILTLNSKNIPDWLRLVDRIPRLEIWNYTNYPLSAKYVTQNFQADSMNPNTDISNLI